MKKFFYLVVLFVSLGVVPAFAHDGNEHLKGTVTKVAATSVVIAAADKAESTVLVTTTTKFEKSGAKATLQDLKVGDRVVIEAKKEGNVLKGVLFRFGPPPPAKAAAGTGGR